MSKLLFLSREGFFAEAALRVRRTTLEDLVLLVDEYKKKNELENASLVAQKACIEHGLEGFKLYLPLKLGLLKKEKESGEYIQYELLKTLSLINFFLQDLGASDEDKAVLEQFKKESISLCSENDLNFVVKEADVLTNTYPGMS